jgi:hypothetical protein
VVVVPVRGRGEVLLEQLESLRASAAPLHLEREEPEAEPPVPEESLSEQALAVPPLPVQMEEASAESDLVTECP